MYSTFHLALLIGLTVETLICAVVARNIERSWRKFGQLVVVILAVSIVLTMAMYIWEERLPRRVASIASESVAMVLAFSIPSFLAVSVTMLTRGIRYGQKWGWLTGFGLGALMLAPVTFHGYMVSILDVVVLTLVCSFSGNCL